MGTWKLICPKGGEYEGECTERHDDKIGFRLQCPSGVKQLSEVGCTSANPGPRRYLPYGLTECEKDNPDVRRKLSRCIRKAEVKCCGGPTSDYSGCTCNPVAVCRAAIPCG